MLTFGSLFAGIGGFDLGLERAGMKCVWQVEIDEFCLKVLNKHWPDVPKYKDVKDVGKHNLESADVICGGFPCQDISNAGKRAGIKGKRSGLWSEMHRVICELRPRYVVVENVAALLYRGMGTVLGDLAESGYDAEWQSLPAAAFGAPHIRERIFILAHAQSVIGDVCSPDGIRSIVRLGQKGKPRRYNFEVLPPSSDWSLYQPPICREDDGIPDRVDQLRALGNAIVPQVAEWIGRQIIDSDIIASRI